MMTARRTEHALRWGLALLAVILAAPATLLALPRPAPLDVAALRAALAAPLQQPEPLRAAEETPLAPAAAPRPAPPVPAAADTIPPADGVYEVSELERKPELRNSDEVAAALTRFYPAALRDAGIGGMTEIQFVIEKDGTVDPSTTHVVSTSRAELGDASVRVAGTFRFAPGLYRGAPVRVVIQMPIRWVPPTAQGEDRADTVYRVPVGAASRASWEVDRVVTDPDALRATREERESVAARARALVAGQYARLAASPPAEGAVLAVVATRDGRVVRSAVLPGIREAAAYQRAAVAPERMLRMLYLPAAPSGLPVNAAWLILK